MAISFYYSSMNSGKTAQLLMSAYSAAECGHNPLLLKPSIDTRDPSVSSRIGISKECVFIKPDSDFNTLVDYSVYDHIFVDEAQFMSRNQLEELVNICDDKNIDIDFYGLRTDYLGNLFEGSAWLLANADRLVEVQGWCSCGRKSTHNLKMVNNTPVFKGNQIDIGGNEKYVAVCRQCYMLKRKTNE